ncbi:MAG: tetratricopeptide repeat protein [Chloroflexi bacterium]|nr:tetratricopeptide repeat protein [Chloroflexota bacterium]
MAVERASAGQPKGGTNSHPGAFPPPDRRTLLPRPRLTNQLHAAIGSGLMVVQGPPGFGKTSLVAGFADEVDYAQAWVALDSACVSPEVLSERLARAFLSDPQFAPPATSARSGDLYAYLNSALRERLAQSQQPMLVVLDNIHEIADSDGALDVVEWLIQAAPDGVEVVLIGRTSVPLDTVDRRVAAGEVLLIEKEQLAFTLEEVEQLIALRGSAMQAVDVMAASAGWPMGIMAVLAGSVLPRSHRGNVWSRYVEKELWAGIPVDLRPDILPLSICDTIESDIAVELIGSEPWKAVRCWLEEHDFLVEAIDEERVRLNPLLREFLRKQFKRESREGFLGAVGRAVAWAERERDISSALEWARSLEDGETLARLLSRHALPLFQQGSISLLERAFASVPRSVLAAWPALIAIRARVLVQTGHNDEALTDVARLLKSAETPADAKVLALLARARGYRQWGRMSELRTVFEEIRAISDGVDPAILAEVEYAEADNELSGFANFGAAEALLTRCIERARAADMRYIELLAQSTLGQLVAMRGDGPAAVEYLNKAAQGWLAVRGTSNLGWVLNNLGMAYLSVGEYQAAVDVLHRAVEEGRACLNIRNQAYATASLADAMVALGHYDEARVQYEDVIRISAEEITDATLAGLSINGLSAALLGLGDVQQADYFAERALVVAETGGNPLEMGTVWLQQAAVRSAAGHHLPAISAAAEAVRLFSEADASESLLLAHFRHGYCAFRADQRDDAHAALREMNALITHPWRVAILQPAVREQPLFAQWAASLPGADSAFRELVKRVTFTAPAEVEAPVKTFAPVRVWSLGQIRVEVDGREVTDEDWMSARAKELFFVFLANKGGIRKEEAVELLYPDLPADKCNSAFHSNVYRVRHALYQDSIVKRNGIYVLNPEGTWDWDVETFEGTLDRARALEAGSPERAALCEQALALYEGPFAETFFSEWASALRRRAQERANHALALLAGYYAGREQFEDAAVCMERLLKSDRYNAEAAYKLACYRVQAGQPVQAISVIDDYRRVHEMELGEPLPQRFQKLRTLIAAGAAS